MERLRTAQVEFLQTDDVGSAEAITSAMRSGACFPSVPMQL
jgi:hypothetical protein